MNDWLILIIVLLIIAIVLDGLRRARKGSAGSVKLSRNARKVDKYFESQDASISSDFPSGGARVAHDSRSKPMPEKTRKEKSPELGEPAQESLDFGEPVPMLMESVESNEGSSQSSNLSSNSSEVELEVEPVEELGERLTPEIEPEVEPENEPELDSIGGHKEPSLGDLDDLDELEEPPQPAPEPVPEKSAPRFNFQRKKAEVKTEAEQKDAPKAQANIEEILIINVMAKPGQMFSGVDLQTAFVNVRLKYGARQIFHRHLNNDGDASVLYSVANMVEPGYFNLSQMNDIETPGVCMFLTLPCDGSSIEAYDDMSDTALAIARELEGELKDENRSVMTRQTIEHGRQKVLEFERRRKLMK